MLTKEERQGRINDAYAKFRAEHPRLVAATNQTSLLICFLAGFTAGHNLGAEEVADMVSSLMGNSPTKEGG